MFKVLISVGVACMALTSLASAGELRVTLNSDSAPAFCEQYKITATGGGKTYTSRLKTLVGEFPSSASVKVEASASGCKNGKDGKTTRTIQMGQDAVDAKVHIVF